MDETTLQRRAEIARKLKAARWLAGGVVPANGRHGKPHKIGWKVHELSAKALVTRSPLAENGWTADRVGRIERMERHVTPMELGALEAALEMPGLFGESDPATRFADAVRREGRRRGERPESKPEDHPDEDADDEAQ